MIIFDDYTNENIIEHIQNSLIFLIIHTEYLL